MSIFSVVMMKIADEREMQKYNKKATTNKETNNNDKKEGTEAIVKQ